MNADLKVGEIVKLRIKAVTTDREFKAIGKIVELHGPVALVRHLQPWSSKVRETPHAVRSLKLFKPKRLAEGRFDYLNRP